MGYTRHAVLYTRPRFGPDDLLADLRRDGITVERSVSGAVRVLGDDGIWTEISESECHKHLSKGVCLAWTDGAGYSLYYAESLGDSILLEDATLDQGDDSEIWCIKTILDRFYRKASSEEAIGLVMDFLGDLYDEFDWTKFFLEGGRLPGRMPNVIGIKSNRCPIEFTNVRTHRQEVLGSYTVLYEPHDVTRANEWRREIWDGHLTGLRRYLLPSWNCDGD